MAPIALHSSPFLTNPPNPPQPSLILLVPPCSLTLSHSSPWPKSPCHPCSLLPHPSQLSQNLHPPSIPILPITFSAVSFSSLCFFLPVHPFLILFHSFFYRPSCQYQICGCGVQKGSCNYRWISISFTKQFASAQQVRQIILGGNPITNPLSVKIVVEGFDSSPSFSEHWI